ncbi:hypothetical protein G7085_05145 [Tessaracoccus sp. HDW20]|uniref:metallophosphoesterase n=1 Tax=Tessaracoccus coleopterorum TaxID=2714950 RepID=UPI0018D3CF49|nr:metallophosphoesterase [Tessaracoccus coleopterorum]NHB84216.1 hypothetical protein [Tessaracoccus coleopterorum]
MGILFKASTSPKTGLTAVHRLYKSSSADFNDVLVGTTAYKSAVANGYTDQGVRFYALASAQSGRTQPVYTYTKSGKHRLATAATSGSLTGWTREAVAFHVPISGATTPTPKPTPTPTPKPTPTPTPTPKPTPTPTPTPKPTPTPPPTSAANESFTVAVIPDTQQETWNDSDTRFAERSAWLVNNAAKLNLKYVTHVGDVVDWGNVAPEQYTRAQKGLAPLKGKVPYSLTLGNHDTGAVCQGGSACPESAPTSPSATPPPSTRPSPDHLHQHQGRLRSRQGRQHLQHLHRRRPEVDGPQPRTLAPPGRHRLGQKGRRSQPRPQRDRLHPLLPQR